MIANGRNFPDALAGSYLSGKYNAPILMANEKAEYAEQLRAYIRENLKSGGKIYVLGGTKAVPNNILNGLDEYQIVRLQGKDRYETSVRVAEEFFAEPKAAVLAYAKNFPDGLCGGMLAMSQKAPLILSVTGNENAAKDYGETYKIEKGAVLGGNSLISDESVREIFSISAIAEITEW